MEAYGRGDFCLAFRLGTIVVRLARHAEAAAALRRETAVLEQIADQLPCPVPRLNFHTPVGCPPFTTHREVVGVPITRERWSSLDSEGQRTLARDTAAFLRALHKIPVSVGLDAGVTRISARWLAEQLRQRLEETACPWIDPSTHTRLTSLLGAWALTTSSETPTSLIHRDIAPGHLLFNEDTGGLAGVIDFGDLAVGHPARDFIDLYEDFGLSICESVMRAYDSGPWSMETVRQWFFLEALNWTLDRTAESDEEEIEAGWKGIEQELASFE